MNRTHIHFALGLPSNRQVISGMRADCEVVIYIDIKAALQGEHYFDSFILPGKCLIQLIPLSCFCKVSLFMGGYRGNSLYSDHETIINKLFCMLQFPNQSESCLIVTCLIVTCSRLYFQQTVTSFTGLKTTLFSVLATITDIFLRSTLLQLSDLRVVENVSVNIFYH